MRLVYQRVSRLALVVTVLALAGCGSHPRSVDLPAHRGYELAGLLRRLHAAGARVTFPASSAPCGNGLRAALVESPQPPARVGRGDVVTLRFGSSEIPSPGFPLHHPRWAYVPQLVGKHPRDADAGLVAMWPCFHLRPAHETTATDLVVVAQSPSAGTRVPAYGVGTQRGYRPTTVQLTIAAR